MKGGVEEATAMVMDLRENYGVFASVVVYPVIPKGHIIYRLIPTASHTDKDIEETLKAFSETKARLDAGAYKAEAIPDMAEYSAKRFEYFNSKPKSSK
jgi:glycine C-acetyltransferase